MSSLVKCKECGTKRYCNDCKFCNCCGLYESDTHTAFLIMIEKVEKMRLALELAKEMFACNDLELPHTLGVIDKALDL